MAVGPGHVCVGPREGDEVRCSGNSKVAVPHLKALAIADSTCCAMDEAGQVVCWSLDSGKHSPSPIRLPGQVSFLSAGGKRFCAVTTQGSVLCWEPNTPVKPVPGVTDAISVK